MNARVIQVPHINYAYVIFEPDTSADDDITQEQSIILKFDDYTKELLTRITELEADALARLIEEPTNERIMKDVYDENERLKARIAELEAEREWQWKNDALDDVLKERQRQEEKWGEQNHNPYIYLAILVEEVGELAQAILHTQFGGSHQGLEEVRKEAIHCAAVGLAVIECLDRKKWQVGDVKFDHLLPKPPEEK